MSGRCEYCGETLVRKKVSVYRHRKGRHVLFKGVPALVCTACGRRLFEADSVEAMEHDLNRLPAGGRKESLLILST